MSLTQQRTFLVGLSVVYMVLAVVFLVGGNMLAALVSVSTSCTYHVGDVLLRCLATEIEDAHE